MPYCTTHEPAGNITNFKLCSLITAYFIVLDSEDYIQRSERVVFAPDVPELVVNITILDDDLSEEDKNFSVQLLPVTERVELVAERGRASVLIVDDDSEYTVMS